MSAFTKLLAVAVPVIGVAALSGRGGRRQIQTNAKRVARRARRELGRASSRRRRGAARMSSRRPARR